MFPTGYFSVPDAAVGYTQCPGGFVIYRVVNPTYAVYPNPTPLYSNPKYDTCVFGNVKSEGSSTNTLKKEKFVLNPDAQPYIPKRVTFGRDEVFFAEEGDAMNVDETEIPHCAEETEMEIPPCVEETEIPPCAEETEIPPCAEETEIPPCAEETEIPPCVEETEIPPNAEETEMEISLCVEETEIHPCAEESVYTSKEETSLPTDEEIQNSPVSVLEGEALEEGEIPQPLRESPEKIREREFTHSFIVGSNFVHCSEYTRFYPEETILPSVIKRNPSSFLCQKVDEFHELMDEVSLLMQKKPLIEARGYSGIERIKSKKILKGLHALFDENKLRMEQDEQQIRTIQNKFLTFFDKVKAEFEEFRIGEFGKALLRSEVPFERLQIYLNVEDRTLVDRQIEQAEEKFLYLYSQTKPAMDKVTATYLTNLRDLKESFPFLDEVCMMCPSFWNVLHTSLDGFLTQAGRRSKAKALAMENLTKAYLDIETDFRFCEISICLYKFQKSMEKSFYSIFSEKAEASRKNPLTRIHEDYTKWALTQEKEVLLSMCQKQSSLDYNSPKEKKLFLSIAKAKVKTAKCLWKASQRSDTVFESGDPSSSYEVGKFQVCEGTQLSERLRKEYLFFKNCFSKLK